MNEDDCFYYENAEMKKEAQKKSLKLVFEDPMFEIATFHIYLKAIAQIETIFKKIKEANGFNLLIKENFAASKEILIDIIKKYLKENPRFDRNKETDIVDMAPFLDDELEEKYQRSNPVLAQLSCLKSFYTSYLSKAEKVKILF